MAGFSSIDDFVSEVTTQGKMWRQDFARVTNAAAQVASVWYSLLPAGGTPPAFLFGGTTKTAVAMSSTPVNITTGTATAASATISTTQTSGLAIGMLVSGSAGTVTIPANAFITAISAGTSFTISAVTGGSSTGTPTLTCAFPTIWHGGDVSTDQKHLVNLGAAVTAAAYGPSWLMLMDHLLYYPIASADLISTSQRTLVNTITLPRYATGAGVRAFFVSTVAATAGGPNLTEFTYTNQAGTSGCKCPIATLSMNATPPAGQIIHTAAGANKLNFIPLQAGDTGIRSVQSFTFSGGTAYTGASAAAALVLARPIASIPIPAAGVASERNLMFQMPSLPRIYDGACLDFLMYAGGATTAATSLYGYLETAWG